MTKKPSYDVIKRELERAWKEAQVPSDYAQSMKQECIQRAIQRIKDSEYEVM